MLNDDILNIEAELETLDSNFKKAGGITHAELQDIYYEIRTEEKERERLNSNLKNLANNVVPFAMIKDNLRSLKKRIISEEKISEMDAFLQVINSGFLDEFSNEELPYDVSVLKRALTKKAKEVIDKDQTRIFNLSMEQSEKLLIDIDKYLTFDPSTITDINHKLKKSREKTGRLKTKIDSSNIELSVNYTEAKEKLLKKKTDDLDKLVSVERLHSELNTEFESLNSEFKNAKLKYEEYIKEHSKRDIALRSIVMIEELEAKLYDDKILEFSHYLKSTINTLMRKKNFVDTVSVDKDFKVKIYKNRKIFVKDLVPYLKKGSIEIKNHFGSLALNSIYAFFNTESINDILNKAEKYKTLMLPIEIDINSLSSGEKQIYVMSLYYSLTRLSTEDIPFVIDTPFARIDSEHRANIADKFFGNLRGQLIILSTNEEVDSNIYAIIKDKIAKTYLLDNKDNTKTNIISNAYFEVRP